jgi:hypothetical protein
VLKPVAQEVGAPWAAFHTFRHTYASLMLAGGANVLQLSRALGHHSPAFTLTVYTHLLDGEHAPPLELASELTRAVPSQAPRAACGGAVTRSLRRGDELTGAMAQIEQQCPNMVRHQ